MAITVDYVLVLIFCLSVALLLRLTDLKTIDPCLTKDNTATILFGKCVKVVSTAPKKWTDALSYNSFISCQAYCRSEFYDGTLVEPTTDTDMRSTIKFLRTKVKSNVWIGANDMAVQRKFVWASNNNTMITKMWAPYEPNDYIGREDCVHIWNKNDLLNDISCNNQFDFLCQMESCNSIFPGSVYGYNHCFKYFDQNMTWEMAKEFCLSINSHLAEAETDGIRDLLNNYLKKYLLKKTAWLGGASDSYDDLKFRWMVSNSTVNSTMVPFRTGPKSLFWTNAKLLWNSSADDMHGFVCQTGNAKKK
ncbi:hypothetical protein Btru_032911 [Bulinus truncatus]|nr:hypothetical protein Btru_032911 [Bulinus truncatus]